MNESLIESTRARIRTMLSEFLNPVILWSGGKDSTALLHIARGMGHEFPVVCWRDPWFPEKLRFINDTIQRFDLVCWDYSPHRVSLCQGNGKIDVLNHYQIGASNELILLRGTYDEGGIIGLERLCGRDTFLSRPRGTFNFPWDCVLHGHKSCDVDPTSGKIPLSVDRLDRPGSAVALYPMRDWTDEDVFEYCEEFGLIDLSRYEKISGIWRNIADRTSNPDYYSACFRCCDPSQPSFVTCPKNGLEINNIHEHIDFTEPRADYCGLRTEEAGV